MGAAPHPIHETLYMGLRPKPHSRTFLPKSPRDPKKPDWIGFGLSNRDREQGCRRQPCIFVWKSISNSIVSFPNDSEKDVKGLLSRKQPLHTSPTTGAKAVELSPAFLRANVCELSHTFLRAMRASPHMHPEGKRKLFPSLVYPTLSLDGAGEWEVKATAPSPRDSTN